MRKALWASVGLILLIVLATPALSGDEKKGPPPPPPPPEPDLTTVEPVLYANLKDVINRGVDLYNAGDIAGCYRLFEGTLRTVRPLLAHRKELSAEIGEKLAAAEKDPTTWRRAFTLRSALDKVRAELKPKAPPPPPDDPGKKKPDDGGLDKKKPDDKKPIEGDDKKKGDEPPVLKKPRELKEEGDD